MSDVHGAIYWARLSRVYYGNTQEIAAKFGFNSQTFDDELAKPRGQRQVPLYPLMADEVIAAFEGWQAVPNRQTC